MKKWFVFSLIVSSVIFTSLSLYAGGVSAKSCKAVVQGQLAFEEKYNLEELRQKWDKLSEKEKQFYRREHIYSADPVGLAEVQRRPKEMTSGDHADTVGVVNQGDVRLDNADPSIVQQIVYPDGTVKFRVGTSGHFFMEFDNPVDAYRGGIKKVSRSRGFYQDGTEFKGPYHPAAWPWDVVIYRNRDGEQIALGGVMRQPAPGQLPNVAEHNPSRSRTWGIVNHVKKADGTWEERVTFYKPVHDFNRRGGGHQGWELHGYGGVLKTVFNPLKGYNEPLVDKDGFYELDYERVKTAKTVDGRSMPWETNLFTRKMHPSLKTTVGPEVEIMPIKNPKTGDYFIGSRRGQNGKVDGYLLEGGNFFRSLTESIDLTVFSGGDYVSRYGIFMGQKKYDETTYQPIVDRDGELIDFADTLNLRKIFNGNWVGRGLIEIAPTDALLKAIAEKRAVVYDEQPGKVYDRKTHKLIYEASKHLWLRFHYLDLSTLPEGYSGDGWAPSYEIFVQLARLVAQVPVKLVKDKKGQYYPVLDVEPKFRFMYEKPRAISTSKAS